MNDQQVEISDIDNQILFTLCHLVDPEIQYSTQSNVYLKALEYCGTDTMKILVFIRIYVEFYFYNFITKRNYDYDDVMNFINVFVEWRQGRKLNFYDDLLEFINTCLLEIHGNDSVLRYKGTFIAWLNGRFNTNEFDQFRNDCNNKNIGITDHDIYVLTVNWALIMNEYIKNEFIKIEEIEPERATFLQVKEDGSNFHELFNEWSTKYSKDKISLNTIYRKYRIQFS